MMVRPQLARMRRRWMQRLSSAWRPHVLYLQGASMSPPDVQAAVHDFGQWCHAHEGAVCRVALSSRWLLCHASPVQAERKVDARALREQALRRWAHYHDVDEARLDADWVCRQVRQGPVALAVASPKALVDGLINQAKAHGVKVQAMLPWWAPGLQARLASADITADKPAGDLALLESGWVTHVQLSRVEGAAPAVQAIWVEAAEHNLRTPGDADVEADASIAPMLTLSMPHVGQASGLVSVAHREMLDVLTGRCASWQASGQVRA